MHQVSSRVPDSGPPGRLSLRRCVAPSHRRRSASCGEGSLFDWGQLPRCSRRLASCHPHLGAHRARGCVPRCRVVVVKVRGLAASGPQTDSTMCLEDLEERRKLASTPHSSVARCRRGVEPCRRSSRVKPIAAGWCVCPRRPPRRPLAGPSQAPHRRCPALPAPRLAPVLPGTQTRAAAGAGCQACACDHMSGLRALSVASSIPPPAPAQQSLMTAPSTASSVLRTPVPTPSTSSSCSHTPPASSCPCPCPRPWPAVATTSSCVLELRPVRHLLSHVHRRCTRCCLRTNSAPAVLEAHPPSPGTPTTNRAGRSQTNHAGGVEHPLWQITTWGLAGHPGPPQWFASSEVSSANLEGHRSGLGSQLSLWL